MIKFNMYNVTNGKDKVRVWYSLYEIRGEVKYITIYAKTYSDRLSKVLPNVINNSDGMTDYFEKDRVDIYENNSLYPAALKALQALKQSRETRKAKRVAA